MIQFRFSHLQRLVAGDAPFGGWAMVMHPLAPFGLTCVPDEPGEEPLVRMLMPSLTAVRFASPSMGSLRLLWLLLRLGHESREDG